LVIKSDVTGDDVFTAFVVDNDKTQPPVIKSAPVDRLIQDGHDFFMSGIRLNEFIKSGDFLSGTFQHLHEIFTIEHQHSRDVAVTVSVGKVL
jgi:hypothetical protein